jgi:hypothetical protein
LQAKGDDMSRRGRFVALAVGAFVISAIFARGDAQAAPFARIGQASDLGFDVVQASFWGEPFPFGYRYKRGQCIRYVPVETPYGLQWRRIIVCR